DRRAILLVAPGFERRLGRAAHRAAGHQSQPRGRGRPCAGRLVGVVGDDLDPFEPYAERLGRDLPQREVRPLADIRRAAAHQRVLDRSAAAQLDHRRRLLGVAETVADILDAAGKTFSVAYLAVLI